MHLGFVAPATAAGPGKGSGRPLVITSRPTPKPLGQNGVARVAAVCRSAMNTRCSIGPNARLLHQRADTLPGIACTRSPGWHVVRISCTDRPACARHTRWLAYCPVNIGTKSDRCVSCPGKAQTAAKHVDKCIYQ